MTAVRVQDSAAVLPSAPFHGVDSVVVESPLPGGVAAVFRFLFSTVPQWVQMLGAVAAVVVGLWVLRLLWLRRAAIRQWITTREKRVQYALVAVLVVTVLGAGGVGAATWDYMEHNNDFCTGCHVMKPAYQEFAGFEDKHDDLECHDCHQQSIYASSRQLFLWVLERPEEIGSHAGVPDIICQDCHATGDTATWQKVTATAGHRVHFESDSADLKEVRCITCHGEEVHRFVPANQTCGQSGCHEESATKIVLGKMADQTAMHCNACHRFTADVPLLATTDSARGTMVPNNTQCLGCHEMERVLAEFDQNLDPHGGTCGTCHNPHEQETPEAAIKTCASAGCHDNWRDEPFHTGLSHRRDAADCVACHAPHRSKVDASDCEGCHTEVRSRGGRPPVPFDTTRALRRISLQHGPTVEEPRGKGDRPPEEPPSGGLVKGQAADSFPHASHRKQACLECHTTQTGHGGLTFEVPRGCNICHHQAPAVNQCAKCHQDGKIATPHPLRLAVTVPTHPTRERPVEFAHTKHTEYRCVECHTTPVTLVSAGAGTCNNCHVEHHEAPKNCLACHVDQTGSGEHKDPVTWHQRCDACHTSATVALLTPARPFCQSCHADLKPEHYPTRECTTCHFLTEPGSFRARLLTPPKP